MFMPVHVKMLGVLIHFTLKIEPSEFSYKQIAMGYKNDDSETSWSLLSLQFITGLLSSLCKHMSTAFMYGELHLAEYMHLSLPKLSHKFSKYIPIMPFVTCISMAFDSRFEDLWIFPRLVNTAFKSKSGKKKKVG